MGLLQEPPGRGGIRLRQCQQTVGSRDTALANLRTGTGSDGGVIPGGAATPAKRGEVTTFNSEPGAEKVALSTPLSRGPQGPLCKAGAPAPGGGGLPLPSPQRPRARPPDARCLHRKGGLPASARGGNRPARAGSKPRAPPSPRGAPRAGALRAAAGEQKFPERARGGRRGLPARRGASAQSPSTQA